MIEDPEDKFLILDGVGPAIQDQKLNVTLQKWFKVVQDECLPVYIHVFSKSQNLHSNTCTDRIWISLSFEEKDQGATFQRLFVLLSGYPYSHDFFAYDSTPLRSVLESPLHPKVFASKTSAVDFTNLIFSYFKVKIRGGQYLAADGDRWDSDVNAIRNERKVKDIIDSTYYCFFNEYGNESIYKSVRSLSFEKISENDDFRMVICLLSIIHKIMYSMIRDEVEKNE